MFFYVKHPGLSITWGKEHAECYTLYLKTSHTPPPSSSAISFIVTKSFNSFAFCLRFLLLVAVVVVVVVDDDDGGGEDDDDDDASDIRALCRTGR